MRIRTLLLFLAVMLTAITSSAVVKTTIAGIDYELYADSTYFYVSGGSGYDIIIADSVKFDGINYPVKVIASGAFQNKEIYNVTLPNTITTIRENAFENSKLVSIELGDNIKWIGASAFKSTANLRNIRLPKTVTSIGASAFYNSGLYSIEIPEGIVKLENHTFEGCKSLTNIKLPSTLRTIGINCFKNCSNLYEIELPDGLTSIGNSCFSNTALREINIPSLVSTIDISTFSGCSFLKKVNLPRALYSIGSSAFKGCESLERIAFPNLTNSIGQEAFSGCKKLKDIYIPESLSIIDYISYNSTYSSFYGCDSIRNVHIRRRIPIAFDKSTFIHAKTDSAATTLYVPAGKINDYKKLACYAGFANIVEESISFTMEQERTLYVGNKAALNVAPVPDIYPLCDLDWGSSNPAVATVDEFGNVTALKPGTTLIKASAVIEDKLVAAQCVVKVLALPSAYFTIENKKMTTDTRHYLPVDMDNKDKIISFQCDIFLPEGMSFFKDDENEYDFTYGGRESRRHVLESRLQKDGSVRVAGYSTDNSAFSGNEGILFNIPVSTPSVAGEYTVEIKNIFVTDASLAEVQLLDTSYTLYIGQSVAGDANGDGRLTINDAAYATAYILGETPAGFNFDAADAVRDGKITLADVSEIVNLVLSSSAASAPKKAAQRVEGYQNPTREGDKMWVENFNILPGETKTVEVFMDNAEPFISFHSEIILPEGLSFVEEDGEYWVDLGTSRKTRSHTIASRLQPDGRLRVVATSSSNSEFKGNSGVLFTFDIAADSSFESDRASELKLVNNYICNRNEENGFTDYDVNNYTAQINSIESGVAELAADEEMVIYVTDGNLLHIDAAQEATVLLASVSGTATPVNLSKGHNEFRITIPGIYIIAHRKVVIL